MRPHRCCRHGRLASQLGHSSERRVAVFVCARLGVGRMCGQHGPTYLTIILSAFLWSLIDYMWDLGFRDPDDDSCGLHPLRSQYGHCVRRALVNMMFTMAIFRDNLGRYCSAPLLVEEE
jgi:hypothetical protein